MQECQGEPLNIVAFTCGGKPLVSSKLGSDRTQLWFFMITYHFMEEETP